MRQRQLTPVRPRLRQRDRPVDTTPADEHHPVITALGEQDLQPLPAQGMERVGDYDETQTIIGLYGTMPPPPESTTAAALSFPASG